ncbi:MAG: AsmA family protein [Acidobacteria bacterium]|nr:AsmA family protein [Acidobacteriota bacterium]
MSMGIKRLAIILGVLILLVVAAGGLLLLFLPTDEIRDRVVAESSAWLRRPVEVESMAVSWWGGFGVSLQGMTVGNPEGFDGEPLLRAESLDVKLQFWPLLSGDYQVDRLVLRQPQIRLLRQSDGRDNFTFPRQAEASPQTAADPSEAADTGDARRLNFDRLEIVDATVTWVDETAGQRMTIDDLDLATEILLSGTEELRAAGTLALAGVHGSANEERPAYNLRFNYQVTLDRAADRLQVTDTTLALTQTGSGGATGELQLGGVVNGLLKALTGEASATGDRADMDLRLAGDLDLALAAPYLAAAGHPDLRGRLTLDLALTGRPDDGATWRPKGSITIHDAAYGDDMIPLPVDRFAAKMTVAPEQIAVEEMTARLGENDLQFSGTLDHPFPTLLPFGGERTKAGRKPFFTFRLTSGRLNVDQFMPQAVPGAETSAVTTPSGEISPVILPDIHGDGRFQVTELIYNRMTLRDVSGRVSLRNRTIRCTDVTGNVFGGRIRAEAAADLSSPAQPDYSGTFAAEDVEVNDVLERFTEFGGHLFGKVSLSGDYHTRGLARETILQALRSQGSTRMEQGKLVTSGTIHTVLNGLARQVGETFDEEQALQHLAAGFRVADGKVYFEGLQFDVRPLGGVSVSGYYSFDGQVDYSGVILLSEEWSARLLPQQGSLGQIGRLFSGGRQSTRLELPLKITGSLDSPRMNLDYKAMLQNAGQNLLEGGASQLLRRLTGQGDKEDEPKKK